MVDEDKKEDKKTEIENETESQKASELPAEEEKIEIEDILENNDLDIDDVVSEEKEKTEPVIESTDETVEETMVDELATEEEANSNVIIEEKEMKSTSTSAEKAPVKNKVKKSKRKPMDKKKLKLAALIVLVALITTAAVLGVMYYLSQRENQEPPVDENEVAEEIIDEEVEESFVYIMSELGLNMREEPNTSAKILAIIPYATKIPVLEEAEGWIKTEYEEKEGWVSAEFTQENNPLAYKDETYGFGLTFKPSWAGYKFFKINSTESTTIVGYYVAIPTNDKSWTEPGSGIETGYASLFAMGVYTKDEWAKLEGQEMKPAKLGESDKYVYTYLPGQAHPTDLGTQYNEINEIIKTFEVLKS
ncbi:SH3 domain-containing protein [Patescibacteria group bacterium]|nr:SH3 domain-containing protein [Patescibacteria group bacterium]